MRVVLQYVRQIGMLKLRVEAHDADVIETPYSAGLFLHFFMRRASWRAAADSATAATPASAAGPDRGRRMGDQERIDRTQLRAADRRIERQALPPRRLSIQSDRGPYRPDLRHRQRPLGARPAAPGAQQPRHGGQRQRKDLPDRRPNPG